MRSTRPWAKTAVTSRTAKAATDQHSWHGVKPRPALAAIEGDTFPSIVVDGCGVDGDLSWNSYEAALFERSWSK